MKKPAYYMIALLFSMLTACGGGSGDQQATEENQQEASMESMMEYDLSQHGLPLTIMIPDESVGIAEVVENELGGVDIVVGKNFGISVAYGIGNIEMLKTDLNDDLVYEASIYVDEPNLVVYEKNIPGAEIEPEHHFLMTNNIDGEVYDVQNITGITFGKAAIEKMVQSAKTLKGKSAS